MRRTSTGTSNPSQNRPSRRTTGVGAEESVTAEKVTSEVDWLVRACSLHTWTANASGRETDGAILPLRHCAWVRRHSTSFRPFLATFRYDYLSVELNMAKYPWRPTAVCACHPSG